MTKIDIISGFLGAGKTTFIKKMIDEAFKGEQIVLIENEFGEVGIDGGFLKDAGIQITEMNSGCICCSLVGDFGKNLNEVITKYHPDRILIEPSGVGKLSDVMKSVIDIEKEQPVKLNALVTVVNALKASKQMKAFGEFFNNQIEYATTVILSRSQNATPEQLEFCVKQIQALNPKASVITTDWDAIKGEQILKTMEGQDNLEMKVLAEARHAQDEAEHHHHHDHDEHEHHHDHDEHEHHHDHDEHEHHHDHDEHEHHHDHDEHEHHHEHGEGCTCGCHDHDHEHGHHPVSYTHLDVYKRQVDLTAEILEEKGFTYDEAGFESCMEAQRQKARGARKETNYMGADANVYNDIDSEITTEFTGYDKLTDTAEIAFLTTSDDVVEALSDGDKGSVIVPNTPFYATMGGQQGDKGIIKTESGKMCIRDRCGYKYKRGHYKGHLVA